MVVIDLSLTEHASVPANGDFSLHSVIRGEPIFRHELQGAATLLCGSGHVPAQLFGGHACRRRMAAKSPSPEATAVGPGPTTLLQMWANVKTFEDLLARVHQRFLCAQLLSFYRLRTFRRA